MGIGPDLMFLGFLTFFGMPTKRAFCGKLDRALNSLAAAGGVGYNNIYDLVIFIISLPHSYLPLLFFRYLTFLRRLPVIICPKTNNFCYRPVAKILFFPKRV